VATGELPERDLVALRDQQLGEVQPVLPGDAGDEGARHRGSLTTRLLRGLVMLGGIMLRALLLRGRDEAR